MNKEQEDLLLQIELYVVDCFEKKINNRFAFHNLEHTQTVVEASLKILKNYTLKPGDALALLAAAWFHDTGFSSGIIEGHEKQSKRIAQSFLSSRIENEIIQKVVSCIQATHIPQQPLTLIEKIICDADLYHLGTNKFEKFSMLLKKEQETYLNKEITGEEWREKNIQFLKSHTYFTEYCRQHLEPVKQEWLRKLESESKPE